MAPQLLKEKIYSLLKQQALDKIARLEKVLSDLRDSVSNETKSTAGDKHETALAMLQIEQERTGRQLQEALMLHGEIMRIDIYKNRDIIGEGSLVFTDSYTFFVGGGAGKMHIEDKDVFSISLASPLAKKLCGFAAGSVINAGEKNYTIKSVF